MDVAVEFLQEEISAKIHDVMVTTTFIDNLPRYKE